MVNFELINLPWYNQRNENDDAIGRVALSSFEFEVK